jgi:heme exporter protein A
MVGQISLELRNVGCARGGRLLFDGLSLQLKAGQWLRVSGDNGAGKSSLLRLLAGLLPPAGGELLWRGAPLAEQHERLGLERLYLGHEPALKDDLSPLENLLASCALAGEPVTTPQALDALHQAGLRGSTHRPARQLSQGQRRRCALARLPLSRRRLLWVLDEPFNALDSAACDWLSSQISGHLKAGGLAVITSHQPLTLDSLPSLGLQL